MYPMKNFIFGLLRREIIFFVIFFRYYTLKQNVLNTNECEKIIREKK